LENVIAFPLGAIEKVIGETVLVFVAETLRLVPENSTVAPHDALIATTSSVKRDKIFFIVV
jgi:hypothetical protein